MKLVDKNLLKNDLQSNKLQIVTSFLVGILIVVMAFISFDNLIKYRATFPSNQLDIIYTGDITTFFVTISLFFGTILFITSILNFNFFKSKEKVDFYNQLPIKRETMFFTKYLSTLLASFIPYVITLLIYVIMYNILLHNNAHIQTYNHDMFIAFIKMCIVGVFFLTLSSLCASISGKMSGHFAVIFTIIVAPQIIIPIIMSFFSLSINRGISQSFYSSGSLIYYFYSYLEKLFLLGPSAYEISALPAIIVIIVTIALLYITLKIYKNFKSEYAGKFITYNWINSFFNYLVAFIVALITLAICANEFNVSYEYVGYTQKVFILLIGFIIVYLIYYVLIVTIRQLRFNKSTINVKSAGIIAIVSVVLFSFAFFDVLNRKEFIPNPSKVVSVTIDNTTFSEPENIEIIEQIHKICIENEVISEESVYNYTQEQNDERVLEYEGASTYIRFYYETKSSEIYREYICMTTNEMYSLLEKLYSSNEYKQFMINYVDSMKEASIKQNEKIKAAKNNPVEQVYQDVAYVSIDNKYTADNYFVNDVDELEFLDLLKKDIENDDNFTNYSEQNMCVLRINLNLTEDIEGQKYIYTNFIYINLKPTYTNTINFLKERSTIIDNSYNFDILTFKNEDDNIIKNDALSKGFEKASIYYNDDYTQKRENGEYIYTYPFDESIALIKNDPKNSDILMLNQTDNKEEIEQFLSETKFYVVNDSTNTVKVSNDTDLYRLYTIRDNELMPIGLYTK